MGKIKILQVVGARPQFIKAAPLSREIGHRADIDEITVHTGQHFDARMSEIFFSELGLPTPNYQLGINSLGHGAMTGRMLEAMEEIFEHEMPDIVVVYCPSPQRV